MRFSSSTTSWDRTRIAADSLAAGKIFKVIFWVNYGWQRGRGSAVEVDGGMTVLRPEISGLLGATIVDQVVIIAPAANYVPEPGIQEVRIVDNAMSMSQDIPLQLLRVYVNAVNKAKVFDEKHRLTANASARVVSFDRRVGLTKKFPVGISVVIEKVKSVDKRFQVCDKTMSALMAAERKINDTDQLLNLAVYVRDSSQLEHFG
ncbi:hypothetical protein OROMI_019116 [Orobanche minor]